MKVNIKIQLTDIQDTPYNNVVTITGYTKSGISKQNIIDWASDTEGEVLEYSPLILEFWGEKGGRDYVALDQFCSWLEDADPEVAIKEVENHSVLHCKHWFCDSIL